MTRDAEHDDFVMLEGQSIDGKDCYVIEGKPKDVGYSYGKTVLFISKQENMILKVEFYSKENMLIKILELSNYKNVQGVLTPMQTKLSTVAINTSTIIELQKVNYGMSVPEKVFTTKYLETGR